MCACLLSTRTSTLIKESFTLGFQGGRADAVGGLEAQPLTLRDAKRAVDQGCRCETARRARKVIARAYRLGYMVGFEDLFANEVASRGTDIVSIEDLRAAKVARTVTLAARRVVGN